jgi:hypothetical protein
MKSRLIYQQVANAQNDVEPDFANLLLEEQSDAAYARFDAMPERAHSDRSKFAYPEDRETVGFVDQQALHCIVEDLQFGHDLRLNC